MRLCQAQCQENKRKVPESPLLTARRGGLTVYATPWSQKWGRRFGSLAFFQQYCGPVFGASSWPHFWDHERANRSWTVLTARISSICWRQPSFCNASRHGHTHTHIHIIYIYISLHIIVEVFIYCIQLSNIYERFRDPRSIERRNVENGLVKEMSAERRHPGGSELGDAWSPCLLMVLRFWANYYDLTATPLESWLVRWIIIISQMIDGWAWDCAWDWIQRLVVGKSLCFWIFNITFCWRWKTCPPVGWFSMITSAKPSWTTSWLVMPWVNLAAAGCMLGYVRSLDGEGSFRFSKQRLQRCLFQILNFFPKDRQIFTINIVLRGSSHRSYLMSNWSCNLLIERHNPSSLFFFCIYDIFYGGY